MALSVCFSCLPPTSFPLLRLISPLPSLFLSCSWAGLSSLGYRDSGHEVLVAALRTEPPVVLSQAHF